MLSLIGGPSVLLWLASALITFLGARTFMEYLRRLNYEGPIRLWRELLLGSGALVLGMWGSLVVDVSAQGLPFELGYHPAKIFGSLLACYLIMVMIVAWVTFRPSRLSQMGAAVVCALLILVLQMSVIWSIGAEPGLYWQTRPMAFALVLELLGLIVAGAMVVGARRGSPGDRGSRRLMAALVLGACVVAAQELILISSGLERQVVSAHARFVPEVAIALLAGAVVPIALVLLLVDQKAQQRSRAAERARRRREQLGSGSNESMFSESLMAELPAEATRR